MIDDSQGAHTMIRYLSFIALAVALTACGEPGGVVVNQETPGGDSTDIGDRVARAYEASVILIVTYFDATCACGDGESEFCDGDRSDDLEAVTTCIRESVDDAPPPPEAIEDYLSCHEDHYPEIYACADSINASAETCDSEIELGCVDEIEGQDSSLHDCEDLVTPELQDWFDNAMADCDP
jgi:hypothetical protein